MKRGVPPLFRPFVARVPRATGRWLLSLDRGGREHRGCAIRVVVRLALKTRRVTARSLPSGVAGNAASNVVLGPVVPRSVNRSMATRHRPGYLLVGPGREQPGHHQCLSTKGCLCALLALLLGMALTAPVSASPVPMKMVRSSNWSGYALTGSAFTGVTGTFNVPVPRKSPDCLEETSVWLGVDGADNSDLLQAGVDESTFVLSSSTSTPWWQPTHLCTGKVQVYARWEDLPSAEVRVKFPVNVGDDVTVSIFKMSPGWWALAMHDLTTRHSFVRVQPYGGPQTSVEWVVEAPQMIDGVTNAVPFGTVDFRDLGAQGELRDLERISAGSNGSFTSSAYAVASTAQLMRSGFDVCWAR
jgi:hypothetical protein